MKVKNKLTGAIREARYILEDLVHNSLYGRPDLIIIGETHTDDGNSGDQARRIARYKPEFVLLEALDGLDPEDTEKVKSFNSVGIDIGSTTTQLVFSRLTFGFVEEKHKHKKLGKTLQLGIETKKNNNYVMIVVSDNGPGIPSKIKQKIFEPLFSTKSFGVGLGLPIVQQIVLQHKGEIEIQSKVGNGTKVLVTLPLSGNI